MKEYDILASMPDDSFFITLELAGKGRAYRIWRSGSTHATLSATVGESLGLARAVETMHERAKLHAARDAKPSPRLNEMILPSSLPEPCEVCKWSNGGWGAEESEATAQDVPSIPGRVVSNLGTLHADTVTLAWGEYGDLGSIRATYYVPVPELN